MPLVSVLIPSYNHAPYLRRCIESVLAQTLEDWELIIVDDRSQDESVSIARSYKDSRIRVEVNPENIGTYATQNRCLDLATGDLVCILNSDDYWRPEKLQRQIEVFGSDPDTSFCYTAGMLTDDEGHEVSGEGHHSDLPRDEVQAIAPYLMIENRVLASSVMFRRGEDRFDASMRYSGDWVMLLRLLQRGAASYVDEPLVVWRQHETNSYKDRLKVFGEEIRVRESILASPDRWLGHGTNVPLLRSKQALCAILLHSVYVMVGDLSKAKLALKKALEIDPGNAQAKKRLMMSVLPLGLQRKRIAPGSDCAEFAHRYKSANLEPVLL